MFATGLGIPVFAAFNSALGQQVHGPVAATAIAFAVGLAISLAILAVIGFPPASSFTFERPYIWTGAAFILFYGVAITFAAPRIGIGNAVFFVLLGQLAAAAVIDHFGLWGAIRSDLTAKRAVGIAVMALGVYLARKPV
ncbi:EamA-like transporter family protein [Novosphingobium sp. Gsoil 351]|nr:EamA-like transporter family protein [Novosphingobium sp. Gsoil 351]